MLTIYEYINPKGEGVISFWGLQTRERALLDAKMLQLSQVDMELALQSYLNGPLRGHRHLYKLRVGRGVRLRPILCRGPADKNNEITFLVAATERDGRYNPSNALSLADERREEVEADNSKRKIYEQD